MTEWRLAFTNKKKQNRAHKKAGEENADCDQDTELRETHRPAQDEREKSDRGCKRTKKYGPAKFCNRRGNGTAMRLTIGPCLLIASKDEDREINAEANQNGAKTHAHHAELSKNEQAKRKRNQTREQER